MILLIMQLSKLFHMSKIIDLMIYRFSHIGEIPLCNGISSRAPHIMGFCFPLCYRCTFIILTMLLSLWFVYRYHKTMKIYWLFICLIPMIFDGCIQTFLGFESTNMRRIITGSLFGMSLGQLIYLGVEKIECWIKYRSTLKL